MFTFGAYPVAVRFRVASVTFALALGAAGAAQPADRAHSPFAGPQIYSIRVDGQQRRNLSQGRGQDDRLARSPDGRTLAFVRFLPEGPADAGSETVWTMRSDGSGQRPLSAECPQHYCFGKPMWSPNGRRVLVAKAHPSFELLIIDVRSRAVRRLAVPVDAGWETPPSWSPDGRWIAFEGYDYSTCGPGRYKNCATLEVWKIRPDGTDRRRLAVKAADPIWSPDGRWIAYRIADGGESLGLGVVRPNGRGRRLVYPPRLRIAGLGPFRWSPSGLLVFNGISGAILTARPDRPGTRQTKLIGLPTAGFFEWAPDRRRIAAIWSPNSGTRPQIWVQNTVGSNRRRVTNEHHTTEIPGGPFLRDVAWSRDGRRLFYVY